MAFKCSRCKNSMLKGERFCPNCGEMFGRLPDPPVKCGKCGHMESRRNARYCTKCGSLLGELLIAI